MDKILKVLLERHNEDKDSCLAWSVGYIDSLERELNRVRAAIGEKTEQTLIEDLREELDAE